MADENVTPDPILDETPEQKPEETPEQKPEETPEQKPDEKPNETPNDPLLDDSPEEKPEEKPEEPEDYDIEVPEGKEFSEEQIKEYKEFAKELGLNKEQAQKILENRLNLAENIKNKAQESLSQAIEKWDKEARSDKEIGGDKFSDSINLGKNVINKYASQEFKDLLRSSNFSRHPEFMRFIARIGKDFDQDSFHGLENQEGTKSTQSLAERLYPSMRKND